MPAYFVVRAVVGEADRRDFDVWYAPNTCRTRARLSTHSPPGAPGAVLIGSCIMRSINSRTCRGRGGEHFASDPPACCHFDARWGSRVTRTREIIEAAE